MTLKYYIMGDLESTLPNGISLINNNSIILSIKEDFRKKLIEIINFSFCDNVTEFITYEECKDYFLQFDSSDEYVISVDNGIFIKEADYYYSANRTYNSEQDILNNPHSYRILQRNFGDLDLQATSLINSILEIGKEEIVIYDDGIFSGDTIYSIISKLSKFKIKVKEIRVILNLSKKDNIEGIPIKSMISPDGYLDWLNERDLFYGVKNSGASFIYDSKVNGIPYIMNPELASKKASIPIESLEFFGEKMFDLNCELWEYTNEQIGRVISILDLPRIHYLKDKYCINKSITKVLEEEKNFYKLNLL